ncbi:MAG TPA: VCBS repeat-containing protein, partial [Cyclobacteriaceae bacterium]
MKKLLFLSYLFCLLLLTKASAQTFTSSGNISLPASSQFSTSRWGDYDNDGDMDLIATGLFNVVPATKIYENVNGNYVVKSFPELVNVFHGILAWGDYNNDGRLDLLISGDSVFNDYKTGVTKIYKNTGSGFKEQFKGLIPPLALGDGEWLDYNNDGLLDFAVTGVSITLKGNGEINQVFLSKLYKNTGSAFEEVFKGQFTGLGYSSLDVADFNADGKPDIVFSGSRESGQGPLDRTLIYENKGDSFAEGYSNQIPGIGFGDIKWWDFDLDGDMDIVLNGVLL